MASGVIRDVRFAIRMLMRTPGFSLVALMTFALGIGVNAAVFTVYNGVLLRPLPYPGADRITMVRRRPPTSSTSWACSRSSAACTRPKRNDRQRLRRTAVLLSHGLWQRRFGGSPAALGQTLTLNGRPHEIIGVMPPSLAVPERASRSHDSAPCSWRASRCSRCCSPASGSTASPPTR